LIFLQLVLLTYYYIKQCLTYHLDRTRQWSKLETLVSKWSTLYWNPFLSSKVTVLCWCFSNVLRSVPDDRFTKVIVNRKSKITLTIVNWGVNKLPKNNRPIKSHIWIQPMLTFPIYANNLKSGTGIASQKIKGGIFELPVYFSGHIIKIRGNCSFYWYWWNWWLSLFNLSSCLHRSGFKTIYIVFITFIRSKSI
jgi:hypothetical protein